MKSNITLKTFEDIVIEQLKARGYNTKIIETPGKLGSEHRLVNVDDLTERHNVLYEQLKMLKKDVKKILQRAPEEDICANEENEIFADLENLYADLDDLLKN